MKINRVHLGRIIAELVNEKELSQAEFARLIGMQRQNIKKAVFEKESLDTNLLCVISEVLNRNLFNYYQCNKDDDATRELKATITIEMGAERQDKTFRFVFGNNEVNLK